MTEEESKHCIRVMRLQSSDCVVLIDGRGGRYVGEIIDPHPKRTVLHIRSYTDEGKRAPYRIHLVVAPTKNIERYEWFLEKVTEIGVDEITPIICERSERKEVKSERLLKVLVAAMKQSKQSVLPKLNEAQKLGDFLKNPTGSKQFIAHCEDGEKVFLHEKLEARENAVILIGPEGDFSSEEIREALEIGYQPISLGATRLRTETAAVVASLEVAIINR